MFVIRRQQVDMPNHCSHWHDLIIFLWNASHCNAKGRYRGFVILLAAPPHSSQQLMCPAASFIHSLLGSFIAPCSQKGFLFQNYISGSLALVAVERFREYSLGSISLIPRSFISAYCSPPAAHFCARRPPHLGCVHLATAIAHSSVISQSIAKVHLHSSSTCVYPSGNIRWRPPMVLAIAPDDRGFLSSPFVGARRPPSFRRSSFTSSAVLRLAGYLLIRYFYGWNSNRSIFILDFKPSQHETDIINCAKHRCKRSLVCAAIYRCN